MTKESPVNSEQARVALGRRVACCDKPKCKRCGGTGWEVKPLSRSYMWALKKSVGKWMGSELGRYFFLSDIRKFLKENPNFNSKAVDEIKPKDNALMNEVLAFLKNPAPLWARSEKREELIGRMEKEMEVA